MEIEALKTMNEGICLNLMTIIEVMALFTTLFAIAGVAIYLAGVAWLWFEEKVSLRRRMGFSQKVATPAGKARSGEARSSKARPGRHLPLTSSLQ